MNIFDSYDKFVKPEMQTHDVKDDSESKLFELDNTEQAEEVEKTEQAEEMSGLSDDDVNKIATRLAEIMSKKEGV